MPYYPNYRLGPLLGSACDTLPHVGINDAEQNLHLNVYPNPASDVVILDYGKLKWNDEEVKLEISNILGQVMHQQILPQYSALQKLNVSKWSNGLYHVVLKQDEKVVSAPKFIKQ